jgi:hypothetical protein
MKKTKTTQSDTRLAGFAKNFVELKRELGATTFFCKGTVLKRMMKCGQKRCACHKDPAKRHGPYFEWTYKEKGKTVNRRLRQEEAPIYEEATKQFRKLHSVLRRMEQISYNAVLHLGSNAIVKQPNDS